MNKKFFTLRDELCRPRTAIFMSGSGSNAEVLLQLAADGRAEEYSISAIVTDNPERSRAQELSRIYEVPLVAHSIRDFYHARGEKRLSLANDRCREIRKEWTNELVEMLEPFKLDFGIFAGFVPLCDITNVFPCLNVHPGDLTVTDADGNRVLVGLNTRPIECAMAAGYSTLRSSVMVTQPLDAEAANVDSGPILGISAPLNIDFRGLTHNDIGKIIAARPKIRPVSGFKDELEEIAAFNQERLKYAGDHVVLPRSTAYFAAGLYSLNQNNELLFKERGKFRKIKTIEFYPDGSSIIVEN